MSPRKDKVSEEVKPICETVEEVKPIPEEVCSPLAGVNVEERPFPHQLIAQLYSQVLEGNLTKFIFSGFYKSGDEERMMTFDSKNMTVLELAGICQMQNVAAQQLLVEKKVENGPRV